MAVHHTGAVKGEWCQIESQENEDVKKEHCHLEI